MIHGTGNARIRRLQRGAELAVWLVFALLIGVGLLGSQLPPMWEEPMLQVDHNLLPAVGFTLGITFALVWPLRWLAHARPRVPYEAGDRLWRTHRDTPPWSVVAALIAVLLFDPIHDGFRTVWLPHCRFEEVSSCLQATGDAIRRHNEWITLATPAAGLVVWWIWIGLRRRRVRSLAMDDRGLVLEGFGLRVSIPWSDLIEVTQRWSLWGRELRLRTQEQAWRLRTDAPRAELRSLVAVASEAAARHAARRGGHEDVPSGLHAVAHVAIPERRSRLPPPCGWGGSERQPRR